MEDLSFKIDQYSSLIFSSLLYAALHCMQPRARHDNVSLFFSIRHSEFKTKYLTIQF